MTTKTLTDLFSSNIFFIPDYQRGYAWEKKQWKDFVEDIDALISGEEEIKHHYTGTVVTYFNDEKALVPYGSIKKLNPVDVVDGQQRLTTSCLYLSVIIRALIKRGKNDYSQAIPEYLFDGTTTRLILNNDANDLFLDLLKTGNPNVAATSTHQRRLTYACDYFDAHVSPKTDEELMALFDAITNKLVFTYYTIEEECEIGMTFELMNSRGKNLSVLELLKNYLMHWVYRNVAEAERQNITGLINKSWKDTYTNIGASQGREDQCLRVAWTLYCNHSPKAWQGYNGFKKDEYFPLRNFGNKSKDVVKKSLVTFAEGLAIISSHYAVITNPTSGNTLSKTEKTWLDKIHNTGNIANFLPLMVAARIKCKSDIIEEAEYYDLLRSLECYAYRVFLFEGKRSNAGQTHLYRQGKELFKNERTIQSVIVSVYGLIPYYASDVSFIGKLDKPFGWYWRRHLLKYTLFEYELYLLEDKKPPALQWQDLSDATLEHILPQTPKEDSHWKQVWSAEDISIYLHDIGNLVLTKDNSRYRNFEYIRKKGDVGVDPSYANSNIKQERKVAIYADWTPLELNARRDTLVKWIKERWKTKKIEACANLDEFEDVDDVDEVDTDQ